MIVMGIGYLIWGFIAPRFSASEAAAPKGAASTAVASIAVAVLLLGAASPASAAGPTLDRVKAAGKIRLGYRTDARPLSFEESGKAAGYSVALCQHRRRRQGRTSPAPWLSNGCRSVDNRRAVQQGETDLLCGAESGRWRGGARCPSRSPSSPAGSGPCCGRTLRRDCVKP
jgi:putrescine:ornithine antiporter